MRICIVGGGIAGLATALRLKQHGIDATVYEKSISPQNSGMGFILLNNGIQAMEELGLSGQVNDFATRLNHALIMRQDGKLVSQTRLDAAYGVSRGKFLRALMNSTQAGMLRQGMAFSELESDNELGNDRNTSLERFKAIHFGNGDRVSGDLFVGADGVHSRMRRKLFPDHQLSPVRVKELVSIVDSPKLFNRLKNGFLKVVHESGGLALGIVPCAQHQLVWYLQYDSQKLDFDISETDRSSTRERVSRMLQGWPDPIPELIESTDFSSSHIWRTTDLGPLPRYHQGNAILLGDAAHALLTFTSQGVNSALEDAVLLADLVAYGGSSNRHLSAIFGQFFNARSNAMERYRRVGRKLCANFVCPRESEKFSVPLALNRDSRA